MTGDLDNPVLEPLEPITLMQAAVYEQSRWIATSEFVPARYMRVLVARDTGMVTIAIWTTLPPCQGWPKSEGHKLAVFPGLVGHWRLPGSAVNLLGVTHWQPLPAPPIKYPPADASAPVEGDP